MSDMSLNKCTAFPQIRMRRNMVTLPEPPRSVNAGNVQSRPKGDSSLGIFFENPLKLQTHSLAYNMCVYTVWTTPIVVDI